ncbi:hypothetical protein TIFTF001_031223 [Ficus carica]|uniref:Uncharacterized protein n=1 Tax=Ficus carica TaxID=3494 RepID=A0AA88DWJ4_FICCA|nr:hypothetical protein TIFTF001_031223 [Ficus carica]
MLEFEDFIRRLTNEKNNAQDSSGKAIIELLDDSHYEQPPKPHLYVKLLENQLDGVKRLSANLLKANNRLKQTCWITALKDSSQRRFKSMVEFYESYGFDFAKNNYRAINNREVNDDDIDYQ